MSTDDLNQADLSRLGWQAVTNNAIEKLFQMQIFHKQLWNHTVLYP